MSSNSDTLKIPIEIKTEDLDEIRALINDISKAEADVKSLKSTPRRGKGTGDTSSKSAFTSPEPRDGGIFGSTSGQALPQQQGGDKTSKTPHQRESEFAKLKNQVNEVEKKQVGGLDALQGSVSGATQGIGFASLLGQGGGAIGKSIGKLASKAFLPLAIATTVIELVKSVLDAALAPGGPLDRRFRRTITEEVANATSLERKQELNQGFKVTRTSLYPSGRGSAGTFSNIRGGVPRPIYDVGLASGAMGI